jgi:enamine deaminase RidA (YjgF/YER057c/UK114 family)
MSARRRTSIYVEGFTHANPIPAACRIGDFVYSGVITGRDPDTNRPAETLERQVAFMFRHLRTIIEASGATLDDVIKVTVWLKDRSDREAVNREWVAMFPDPQDRPARQAHAADLSGGNLVQCDFIAVVAPDSPV